MQYRIETPTPTMSHFFECHTQEGFGAVPMCTAHIHDWVEILYCLQGNLEVLLEGKTCPFSAGDLLIVPSHEVHQISGVTEETHAYIVLKFLPELMNTSMRTQSEYRCILPFLLHGNGKQQLFTAAELKDSPIPALARRFYQEYTEMDFGYEIALKADFYYLILWILRRWHANDPEEKNFTLKQYEQLQQIFDYVAENYASEISVASMAELCHVSYSYFSKLFTKMTGQTFVEYLNAVRLSAAERLLITTEMNITEISFATGFSDLSYFTRRFTAKNRMSPRQYRETYLLEGK